MQAPGTPQLQAQPISLPLSLAQNQHRPQRADPASPPASPSGVHPNPPASLPGRQRPAALLLCLAPQHQQLHSQLQIKVHVHVLVLLRQLLRKLPLRLHQSAKQLLSHRAGQQQQHRWVRQGTACRCTSLLGKPARLLVQEMGCTRPQALPNTPAAAAAQQGPGGMAGRFPAALARSAAPGFHPTRS